MNRIKAIYSWYLLGLKRGVGLREKFRLANFLSLARFFNKGGHIVKYFRICIEGRELMAGIRNNFADPFIFSEVFGSVDYAEGLPADEPKVIFDIGANVGYVTLYLKACYPNARIYCFEPDPENYALLLENTKEYDDVQCFKLAVGGDNETRTFYRSPNFHMRNSLISHEEGSESFEVEVITLREVFERTQVKQVDLLKIDIEGAEYETFESFAGELPVTHIVGELHPYMVDSSRAEKTLGRLESEFNLSVRTEGKKVFMSGPHR